MNARLEGRTAVVTGGARGTGAAVARRFVAEGARVLIVDLLDDQGAELAADLGDAARYLHADVTSERDWTNAIETVEGWAGRLDVLVNNAAVLHLAPIGETTAVDFEHVMGVNALGPLLGIKAAAPLLSATGGGAIVNVGSIDSVTGTPATVAYTASKFALRGITKVAALEYGQHSIRVNCVCPAAGNPEMIVPFLDRIGANEGDGPTQRADPTARPINRAGTPEDVVGAVLYFASDDSMFCTGTELVIDGGYEAGMYVDVGKMFRAGT